MPSVTNGRVLFNSIPSGYPEPGKTVVYDASQNIDLENVPLHGGLLIKTLVLSIDPYMRGRMRAPEVKSYAPPFLIGQPIYGYGVGVVLRSENADVKQGDHVYGGLKHQQYDIKPNMDSLTILRNEHKLPWSVYVGAAGMPGETAFAGWREFSEAKSGEVAFVSAGAGPVGSMVIQIAKEAGLKVIASAGSDEKVKFMKECGADVAFNYKTTSTTDVLAKEGPIDVYWDNVGGTTLDAALAAANVRARFIECGMISSYNVPVPVHNLGHVVGKSLTLRGFIVFNYEAKYKEEFHKTIPPLLASGKIKYSEDVTRGLDKVGDVILAVQKGTNKGKAVVVVADD